MSKSTKGPSRAQVRKNLEPINQAAAADRAARSPDPKRFDARDGLAGLAAREAVDRPLHYGGKDSPTEAIKVIEAHGLGFCLGNAVKYILRAGKKRSMLEDLKKARWYLDREIARVEGLHLMGHVVGGVRDVFEPALSTLEER